jgi:hypothetical protein
MSGRPFVVIALVAIASCAVLSCGVEEVPRGAPPREPKADAFVSSPRVKVAQPVELKISVEHPSDTKAKFPPIGAEEGGLEVVEAEKVRTRRFEPGVSLTERTLTLRGFRTGPYTLGPFEILLVPTEGAVRTLTTPKAQVEIYSVLSTRSTLDDLRPSKGPFALPPTPARWGLTAGVVLAALAVVALVVFLLVRSATKAEKTTLAAATRPADEVALEELRKIRESGILEDGHVAQYTDEVSDVLRRYLEDRFDLPAPERTTEEFLDVIAREPILDRDRKKFLADYLAQCDLVKFAAQDPGRRELDELFAASVRFVKETAGELAVTSAKARR